MQTYNMQPHLNKILFKKKLNKRKLAENKIVTK